MSRPPAPELPWLTEAIQMMVRNGLTLRQASNDLNVAVTSADLENIQRRRSFQELLRKERLRYYQELGASSEVTKAALIGRYLILADKLEQEGEHKACAEVLFMVNKLRGEVGAESNVNVFADLTAKDYERIRRNLEEGKVPRNVGSDRPN